MARTPVGVPAALFSVVVVVLVALVFSGGRDEVAAPVSPESATVDAPAITIVPERDPTVASSPEDTTTRAVAEVHAGPEGSSVQVLVVDAGGSPVASARVVYLDTQRTQETARSLAPEERQRLARNDRLWLQQFGAIAVTDRDGMARWPWRPVDRSTWHAVVEHEGSFAETWVRMSAPPTEIHRLQLLPDRSFLVRVLDAERQPVADVALQARHRHVDGRQQPMQRRLATTDAQGLANIVHVQTWQAEVLERGVSRPVTIAARLPGVDVGLEVDMTSLPGEPLELVLPPCGAIEFALRNAFSEPVVGAEIELFEEHADGLQDHTATTDQQGIARFAHVGLGRSFQHAMAHSPPERRRVVTGPKFAKEVIRVEVAPAVTPIVRGRLLRDQTPVKDTALHVGSGDAWITSAAVHTDGDGNFRIAVRGDWRDRELTGLTVRPMDANGTTGEVATWRGNLRLELGAHDLGVLVLQPEPIIVAGQLVLADGEPVPAEVRVHVESKDPDSGDWQSFGGPCRREPGGRFMMFGAAPPTALQVEVITWNRFLPVPPVPFAAGARDLRIELRRGGSVRASIVAGSQIAAFCLQPLLVPAVEQTLRPYARFNPQLDSRMPRESGFVADDPIEVGYTWPAVAPGRYRLEIGARGLPLALAIVADVLVVDGECNDEPRLQHMVVPGLQTIELTLPQAAAVPQVEGGGAGVVAVLSGDAPGPQCWQVDSPMVLFATTQPLDVLVRLNGRRDRVIRGITQNLTIELAPGVPVTVRAHDQDGIAFDGELRLLSLDDPLSAITPTVYSAAMGGAPPPYRMRAIGGGAQQGRLTVHLPHPGRYRLLAHGTNNGSLPFTTEPTELRIGDAGGEFEVLVRRDGR